MKPLHLYAIAVVLMLLSGVGASSAHAKKLGPPIPAVPSAIPAGTLHLTFHGFTPEQQMVIEQQVMPLVDGFAGKPWQDMNIDVYGNAKIGDDLSRYKPLCSKAPYAIIKVAKASDFASLAHALESAHQGCFAFYPDAGFAQGLAYAARLLAEAKFGPPGCSPTECYKLRYRDANRPQLAGGTDFVYRSFSGLNGDRGIVGGMGWLQYERAHPGFVKQFHAELCRLIFNEQQKQGGNMHHGTRWPFVPFLVGDRLKPDFANWFVRQRVFDERPKGDQVLIVPFQDHISVIAIRRSRSGFERPMKHRLVTMAADAHRFHLRIQMDTLENGIISEYFPSYVRGLMRVRAWSGRLHDQLTYRVG